MMQYPPLLSHRSDLPVHVLHWLSVILRNDFGLTVVMSKAVKLIVRFWGGM